MCVNVCVQLKMYLKYKKYTIKANHSECELEIVNFLYY